MTFTFRLKRKKRRPVEAESKGRNGGKRLISPSEGEFFLNKVWNALLCFIICSLNLIFKFTNRAPRKRRKEEHAQEAWTYVPPGPNGPRGAMKERERKGGGGSGAISMPEDKPLRSWRPHSKSGNHATLIPNFKHLHPTAEPLGAASTSSR